MGYIEHFTGKRTIHFKCDNCLNCQDPIDPECTYPASDCTRHEATNACEMCAYNPCICETLDNKRKYPWEHWTI